jgi:hypothetical protein
VYIYKKLHQESEYTAKKVTGFPFSSWVVTTKLLARNNKIILRQGEFG